ncbi:PREDICTED: WNT1-inducible-signaling pathway protein 2 isoform X1 [Sturnus vulgaris]|uniref:WNT1-inducible-signaling pathway protein 2 isoform X1 n=1 Tax=Sturnus vulgaris TaxID=9172 RepID=UPI000719F819|nr:PREDICTED: WNT1-inducible-signaling pathway protein 2 isoform X1 [Sturnus vulgaris]
MRRQGRGRGWGMNMLLHAHVCPAHRSVTSVVSPLQSLCSSPQLPPALPPAIPISLSLCPLRAPRLSLAVEDDEEGCEVNGRLYRDGEVFQPSCKIQCQCLDGGFNCIPLCQEDVRLPTPDCPYPRRVEIPGKCCPEWICEAQDQHLLRDARAGKMQSSSREGMPTQVSGDGPFPPGCGTSAGDTSHVSLPRRAVPAAPQGTAQHLLQPPFPLLCPFLQPPGQCPHCCDTPARSGARSGAPARPPAGWALPPACPTRTATAGWRPRGGSAWSDPARPCRQRSQRREEEVICSCAHPRFTLKPTPHPGKESGTNPWHCGYGEDGGCFHWENREEIIDFGCKGGWKQRTRSLCHPSLASSVHPAAPGRVTGQHSEFLRLNEMGNGEILLQA